MGIGREGVGLREEEELDDEVSDGADGLAGERILGKLNLVRVFECGAPGATSCRHLWMRS